MTSFTLAQLISIFGDRLNQFSIVGMIGKVNPGSSTELLILALFTQIPVLLFAPLFGSLIDRWRKGAVMVLSDLLRAGIVLSLPTLFLHFDSLYAFYVPVALLSMANLMFSPAKSAVIPEIVEESRLEQVNALLWGVGIIGTISGFLLGGWLFDYHSWQLCFYADAMSYFLSVLLLLPLLYLPGKTPTLGRELDFSAATAYKHPYIWIRNVGTSIKEGITIIKSNDIIGINLVVQTSLFGLAGVLYVLGIGYIQEISPRDKTMYLSITATCATVGLLLGSLIAGSYKSRLSNHHTLSIATILIGTSLIGIAKSETLLPLSIWAAALGTAISPVIVLTETMLQRYIPENFRGRVFSTREVLTKTAFLSLAMLATIINAFASKASILLSIGLFLALLGMLLERRKFLRI